MSKTEPILQEEYKGYIVKVLIDDSGVDSPREWSNLGNMICFHRRANYGDKHVTQSIIEKVEKVLKGEVETYSRYLNGEVYGWTIAKQETPDEITDSVWGYIDDTDYVLKEAKDSVDWNVKHEAERMKLAKLEVCS